MNGFPQKHDGARQNRVLKDQAERHEDRTKAQARKNGNDKIRRQMAKARAVEHKRASGRAKMAINKGEAEQYGSAKDQRRR